MNPEVFRKLYQSPRYYSELLLKIKTKDSKIKPLFFNVAQRELYQTVQRLRIEKKPVRVIVLKARQVGISTGIAGLIYHHTATRSNVSSLISSHDIDSSEHIYAMYRMFYERSDALFRPMLRYSNRKELLFENPNESLRGKHPGLNSSILVQTSKNTSLGRSFTIQNFHGSEVAFWENPSSVMEGVEQAVPEQPGTSIFLESTANGMGNYFYEKCVRAAEGKSNYRLVFIPWFLEPGYAASGEPLGALSDRADGEYGDEVELKKLYNLSDYQLLWRRRKIDNAFEGSVHRFCQEYPSNWREAFVFSGQPMFNVKILLSMRDSCPEPGRVGEIVGEGGATSFRARTGGQLRVWEEPKNDPYGIGVDVAEGVGGGDYSCIQVVNARTLNQAAEWWGHIEPDALGYLAVYLARMYRDGLLGIEVNNHGLTTVTKAHELGYWNQYRRTVFDKVKKMRRDSLGWKTSSITKPLVIDGLRKVTREGEILINSRETVDEMLYYVLHEDGTMGATEGKHDDRVIALAIAVEMARQSAIRSGIERDTGPKPFTFDYFDQMAERLEEERNRPVEIGSYHRPFDA